MADTKLVDNFINKTTGDKIEICDTEARTLAEQNASEITDLNETFTESLGMARILTGALASGASFEFSGTSAFIFAAYSNANYGIWWARNRSDYTTTLLAGGSALEVTASSGNYSLTNGTNGTANYAIIIY